MTFLYPRSLFWQKCQLATLYHLRIHYCVDQKMALAIPSKQSSNVIYDESYSNLCAVNSLRKSLEAPCSIIPSLSHQATNPTYVNTHPINSNLWGFPLLARRSQFLLRYKKSQDTEKLQHEQVNITPELTDSIWEVNFHTIILLTK